jgi:phosphopantetheine adenylyltransferase
MSLEEIEKRIEELDTILEKKENDVEDLIVFINNNKNKL